MVLPGTDESHARWDEHVLSCVSPNPYQGYAWGEYQRTRGWDVIRLIYQTDRQQRALCQCLVKQIKLLNVCILWVPGGPLFTDKPVLGELLKYLQGYFRSSKCVIRFNQLVEYSRELEELFRVGNFHRPSVRLSSSSLTFLINTEKSEEELIRGMSSNWRHNLRRGMKEGMTVDICEDYRSFEKFYMMYQEMTTIKQIVPLFSLKDIWALKKSFGDSFKLFTMNKDGTLLSGRGVIVFGGRMFDLIAATSREGRLNYASYCMVFNVLRWCSNNGIEEFDFNGIDPINNKGVYNFKAGVKGKMVQLLGEWEWSNSPLYSFGVNSLVRMRQHLKRPAMQVTCRV